MVRNKMIISKLDLLPDELINNIWSYEGSKEKNFNECVKELSSIFDQYTTAYNRAVTLDLNYRNRMIWPMNYMNNNPTQFLYTYTNKEHTYFLKKIREINSFLKVI